MKVMITTLNGLSYAALLFIMSSGFSLIFGLMRVVNMSHASLFTLGAYFCVSITQQVGSLTVGIIGATIVLFLFGLFMERFLLRRFHGQTTDLMLLTIGVMWILGDLMLVLWHGVQMKTNMPKIFQGAATIFGGSFPKYRLFLIGLGVVACIILWLFIDRTKFGAMIRAGADNREMTRAIGIKINRLFMLTFAIGIGLAAFGGAVSTPSISADAGSSMVLFTLSLVVVNLGGAGTVAGVIAGSLFAGLVDSFGRSYFPELAYFTMFVPLAIVMVFRPQGLLGKKIK